MSYFDLPPDFFKSWDGADYFQKKVYESFWNTESSNKRELLDGEHLVTDHKGGFWLCSCPYTNYYHDVKMLEDGEYSSYLIQLTEYTIKIEKDTDADPKETSLSRVQ